MRIAAFVMAPVLLSFAAVQLNDPDPLGWTAIYAVAGLLSLAAALRRDVSRPCWVVAAVAFVWALTLVPEALHLQHVGDFAARMDIMRPEIEIARELGGLLIVLGWMVALARSRISPSATPSS